MALNKTIFLSYSALDLFYFVSNAYLPNSKMLTGSAWLELANSGRNRGPAAAPTQSERERTGQTQVWFGPLSMGCPVRGAEPAQGAIVITC
jgi:hypothetical protein